MAEPTEEELQEWLKDIEYLVEALKESFESTDARHSIDEMNDTLYIELEGLQDYSEEEIAEIAGPLLKTIDLDFEDIILLPL